MQAVLGTDISGVTVQTMMWSICAVSMPASSMARRAASKAMVPEFSASSAMRRSLMPVREVIQASLVSHIRVRSSLVRIRDGT